MPNPPDEGISYSVKPQFQFQGTFSKGTYTYNHAGSFVQEINRTQGVTIFDTSRWDLRPTTA